MPTWKKATPKERATVLQRLIDDPGFRHKVENDPVVAFADQGIQLDPAEVPRGRPIKMPSGKVIQHNLKRMAEAGSVLQCAIWDLF